MLDKISYERVYDIVPELSWISGFNYDLKDIEYTGNIMQYYVCWLKGQEEPSQNIEKYVVSKYGYILGN